MPIIIDNAPSVKLKSTSLQAEDVFNVQSVGINYATFVVQIGNKKKQVKIMYVAIRVKS